jgi:hypothetical protein
MKRTLTSPRTGNLSKGCIFDGGWVCASSTPPARSRRALSCPLPVCSCSESYPRPSMAKPRRAHAAPWLIPLGTFAVRTGFRDWLACADLGAVLAA